MNIQKDWKAKLESAYSFMLKYSKITVCLILCYGCRQNSAALFTESLFILFSTFQGREEITTIMPESSIPNKTIVHSTTYGLNPTPATITLPKVPNGFDSAANRGN